MRAFARAHGELLFVFAVGATAQAETWLDPTWQDGRRPLAVLALAMTATLLLRIRRPFVALAGAIALMEVLVRFDTIPDNDPMTAVIIVMIAAYSAGAHARGRSLGAAVVVLAAATGMAMVDDGESLNISGFLFFGFFFGAPFLVGLAIRARRGRELLLVQERDERARAAVAEERTRIARELHDVVAHAIGVIVLQARGARRSLEVAPADARSALDAIEATASGALAEMRRLLGVLREDGEEAALAPQPSLVQVERLAAKVRDAGLPVEVHITGAARDLPPGIDLSAYRIVQEALTNALKHAGPARARVDVHYGDDHVAIEVADDGVGGANGTQATGHGLVGMRERVAVFGGERQRPSQGRRVCRTGEAAAVIRVLLADDQRLVRSGFRMILRAEAGIEVVGEAGDGAEAVAAVRELCPDVVLMDVRMPEMDGIEATRRIVAAVDAPRVLVLTTFDLDEYVFGALRAGASGFLLKDAPVEQLVSAIRIVADGGSLFAPSVTRRLIERFATLDGDGPPPASLEELTARELEILRLLARGLSNAEIAGELVVSEHTVKTHVARVLSKLDLRDRTQAVIAAYESGLVRPGEPERAA